MAGGGFRDATPEQRREWSRKGGRAVQELKRGHQWSSPEEASAASKQRVVYTAQRIAEWIRNGFQEDSKYCPLSSRERGILNELADRIEAGECK